MKGIVRVSKRAPLVCVSSSSLPLFSHFLTANNATPLKDVDLHIRQLMHTAERLPHLIYWFSLRISLSLNAWHACNLRIWVIFPFLAQGKWLGSFTPHSPPARRGTWTAIEAHVAKPFDHLSVCVLTLFFSQISTVFIVTPFKTRSHAT